MAKLAWAFVFILLAAAAVQAAPYTYQVVLNGKTVGNERFSLKRTGGHLVMTGERVIEGSKGLIKTRYRITALAPFMEPVAVALSHEKVGEEALVLRLRVKEGQAELSGHSNKTFPLPKNSTVLESRCVGTYFGLVQSYDRQRRGRQEFKAVMLRDGSLADVEMDYRGEEVVNGPKAGEVLRRYSLTGAGRPSMIWADKWGNVVRVQRERDGFDVYLEGYRHAFADTSETPEASDKIKSLIVAIPAKGAVLEGTLTLPPKGKRDLTAVLLIGDGGFVGRDGSSPYRNSAPILKELAQYFANKGMATLRYDKRSLHETKAEQGAPGFDTEVSDVISALAYLGKRRETEKERLLLLGHGLGATVAAAATAKVEERLSGLLLLAPFAPSPTVALKRAVDLALHEAKVDTLYRKNTLSAIDKFSDTLEKGGSLEGQPLDLANDLPLYRFLVQEAPFLKGHMQKDISTYLPPLSLPILILAGFGDEYIPRWSTFNAEKALRDGANTDYVVKKLPGFDHYFQSTRKESKEDSPFFKALDKWLSAQPFSQNQ